ncbi:DUF4306 domain-containing protein [Rossellomorea aquimaris]|uniref:DUF4306 domain-containing protein n=1 Tax=Rossellomorea aquimaris TaxID=189382 RepID=UPI0009ECF144|nr:DUF4306 domain-containing protein [Rossellomorea aquimaris]
MRAVDYWMIHGNGIIAPFSVWIHGSTLNREFISDLDFFVYAAKFAPVFPLLMVVSRLYLLTITFHSILKSRSNVFTIYLVFIGSKLVIGSFFYFHRQQMGVSYSFLGFSPWGCPLWLAH